MSCKACDDDLGRHDEDCIFTRMVRGTYWTKTARPAESLAARVRKIANSPSPWIPGAQADLIREIATALETCEELHDQRL